MGKDLAQLLAFDFTILSIVTLHVHFLPIVINTILINHFCSSVYDFVPRLNEQKSVYLFRHHYTQLTTPLFYKRGLMWSITYR